MRANPEVLRKHWLRFCALRRAWEAGLDAEEAGRALLPIGPPPAPSVPAGSALPA